MSQRKTSKEEKFLSKLYELASAKGDPHQEIDRYTIGEAIGERPKGADHTVQVLTKNGLIKKGEEKSVYLSDFGLKFVIEHQGKE